MDVLPTGALVAGEVAGTVSGTVVGGAVVGLVVGRTQAGRPHMLSVLPMAAIMDRCAALGDAAGLVITHTAARCRLPPPPWPRWRPTAGPATCASCAI